MIIDPNDKFKEAKINALKIKRQEDLDALELTKMQETKSKKARSIKEFNARLTEANQDQKRNTITDFDKNDSNPSIYELQNPHV